MAKPILLLATLPFPGFYCSEYSEALAEAFATALLAGLSRDEAKRQASEVRS